MRAGLKNKNDAKKWSLGFRSPNCFDLACVPQPLKPTASNNSAHKTQRTSHESTRAHVLTQTHRASAPVPHSLTQTRTRHQEQHGKRNNTFLSLLALRWSDSPRATRQRSVSFPILCVSVSVRPSVSTCRVCVSIPAFDITDPPVQLQPPSPFFFLWKHFPNTPHKRKQNIRTTINHKTTRLRRRS